MIKEKTEYIRLQNRKLRSNKKDKFLSIKQLESDFDDIINFLHKKRNEKYH